MNQPLGALEPRLNRPVSRGSRSLIGPLGLSLPCAALQPLPRAFVVFTARRLFSLRQHRPRGSGSLSLAAPESICAVRPRGC